MADKIQILIEAILQKTSKENLEKELQQIQDKLKPLEVKTDIKQASQELQKFAQTFVQVEGSSEKLIKETEQYKNSLGQIVKEIRNIQEVTDEQGNVQQKISSTIKTITTDYQKQRQELEKINAEQSKYWSQRVKETVSDMTRKPDELVKMADYYKQLEQESAKLAQMDEKREQAELEYWSKRRKEAVEAITQTNTELVKMREYYSELEKVSAKENVRVFNLGTNLTDKTSGFTGVDRESAERYAKEIYGADAAVTKFNQTMDKNGKIVSDATVRVNKNSKEYTEYRMKLDEATKSVNQFGEAINRKTGKDMGIFEQFRVALERFPVWIVSATLFMGAIHKIQEGISFIEDMNKVFTNLQMEMTNANLNFKEITKTANDYAIAMGTTTEQVMKAIGVFSTYTSTIDEVLQKSKAAIILSNITGQNIEQSSDQLMGTMEQFDMSAESSMHVVDIIAGTARMLQVDYPQAVQQISDGLRTVGSVAKESKISIEQLSSMIGTLVEKTRRSGTEVSNALFRFEALVA